MTEDRVGFLCNIALSLPPKNHTLKVLRSYYLMRSNDVAKGYGLPRKYFSTTVRCSHCYSDWTRDSIVKVQPLKHTKKHHQPIKSKRKLEHKNNFKGQKRLLQNELVQICTFCKRATTTHLIKPERLYKSKLTQHISKPRPTKLDKKNVNKIETNKKVTSSKDKKDVINLYTKAFDVFSLKNDKNTLSSTIKEPPKLIKNNKKKKDKYAGLCQKAVLATSYLKEQKEKQTHVKQQNKLSLFLKPSG